MDPHLFHIHKLADCFLIIQPVFLLICWKEKNTLTPFLPAGFSSEEEGPPPKQDNRKYMNQPHLRFEITSEDGFSVKADSIEGMTASCYVHALNIRGCTSVPNALSILYATATL